MQNDTTTASQQGRPMYINLNEIKLDAKVQKRTSTGILPEAIVTINAKEKNMHPTCQY